MALHGSRASAVLKSCAFRLQISGNVKEWKVHDLEDLREMSHSQQRQKIDEIDWLITIFGSDKVGAVPAVSDQHPEEEPPIPATPTKHSHRKPEADKSEFPPPAFKDKVADNEDVKGDDDGNPVETFDAAPIENLKPLYNFRKVFQRLLEIADTDPTTAKRLILGLHERFYHAPLGDLRNMLARCGMPASVLNLVAEAVKGCAVCRKYVRLPNRPQVKITNSNVFNDRIQMDLFQFNGKWIALIVCEATRYKIATRVVDRGWKELTRMLLRSWFMYFGPPRQLVADQEASIMGHEASADLERFSVERCPKGTTSGAAGQQHTGTGLAERHVALTELTMNKLSCELNRQGLYADEDELAMESAMSQNITLNYGGVTPAMAVFGVLPRPFYDHAADNIMSDAGALQTDISQFERALRVRQLAMSCVQQAIAEDRVARAGRTRTNQLDLSKLVAGTTQVDIYRDGWRGPAELLRINAEEGTAVVQYQGRPYLMGLRHLRLHENTSFAVWPSEVQEAVVELKQVAEALRPYKVSTVGWIRDERDGSISWRRASSEFNQYKHIMNMATTVGRHLSDRPVGGIAIGVGVRHFRPPPTSIGVLLFWAMGSDQHASQEHWSSSTIKIRDLAPVPVDDLCFIYLFFYQSYDEEPRPPVRETPEVSMRPVELDDEDPMELEDITLDVKRKGPETRTVTLGPESKKQRTELLVQAIYNMDSEKPDHYLLEYQWLMDRKHKFRVGFQYQLSSFCNLAQVSLLDAHLLRCARASFTTATTREQRPLVIWPGKVHQSFFVDLLNCETFKVDTDTDNIPESDVYEIWDEVETVDAKEVGQFVDTKCFKRVHLSSVTSDTVVIDAVWVRKYKRKDGKVIVKSRLCARGCFDPHREHLTTRSTTATRLSQRLVLSTAANHEFEGESWDISGAFLKGLTFEKVRKLLRNKGIMSPVRKVIIIPPPNVWRHLAARDPSFESHGNFGAYGLETDKLVYGLNDAPLAWQLCLHEFLKLIGGCPSVMDENLFIWKTPPPEEKLKALMTTHVDDLFSAAKQRWLDENYQKVKFEFGDVSRQLMPFDHCGCRYERIPDGYKMSQAHFAEKLVQAPVNDKRKDSDPLTPEELTSFRSVLGGLLWVTATRLDLIADVSLLQSCVTKACIEHLKMANKVVLKAKNPSCLHLGLFFRKLSGNIRLMCVHDASSASKGRNYAQEGILVLLCEDKLRIDDQHYKIEADDQLADALGGRAHVLWSHGAKAKRVSYSTSHAETLAAIGGLETVTLVSVRLCEMFLMGSQPSLAELTKVQEHGHPQLPIDSLTDCKDFYELSTGDRSLPQDKGQRLYILAHKEARLLGRLRWLVLVPTQKV